MENDPTRVIEELRAGGFDGRWGLLRPRNSDALDTGGVKQPGGGGGGRGRFKAEACSSKRAIF